MIDFDQSMRLTRAVNDEHEHELCGALMLGGAQAVDDALDAGLEPQHFRDSACRAVFTLCVSRHRDGLPFTPEQIAPLVCSDATVDQLEQMLAATTHGLHSAFHASRIIAAWKRSEFVSVAATARQAMSQPGSDVDGILAEAVASIQSIRDSHQTDESGSIADHLLERITQPAVPRISTSLFDLDLMLDGGFGAGQFAVIGARPSTGKTALLGSIAIGIAQQSIPVLFLNCEVAAAELTDRFVKQFGCNDIHDTDRLNALGRLPLFARESIGWSIQRLESTVRRYVRQHGIRIAFLDYLSLVGPRDSRLPRWEAVGDISRSLKRIALTNGIAVVAAQQLSRDIETRESKRPRMSDFRESGSVEQDADVLIGIERAVRPDEGDRTSAILHIMKNRNGETGCVQLRFDPQRTLFADAGFTT